MTDLGNALEGRCTGSYGAIEAAIAKVLSDENFHQHGLVGAALSREMVTPNDVNAFALSDLKWSAVFFHGARGGLRSASPNFLTWTSTCTLLKGDNLQEGAQNIAKLCKDVWAWRTVLKHFSTNDELFKALLNGCPFKIGQGRWGGEQSLPSLEERRAEMIAEKQIYEEKKKLLIATKGGNRRQEAALGD